MAKKVSMKISSHNVNGYKEDYINSRCNNSLNSIFCIQEHWLRPTHKKIRSINQLRVAHPSFDGYGVSAMKGVHFNGVNRGRGFGGTGFIFSKSFTPFLRPALQYETDRMTVMKLTDTGGPIFIINVYCPYKKSGEEHKVEYLETLGAVENVILSNPTTRFIILGDLNYDIYDTRQPMSRAINELLVKYDLICTHDLDENFLVHNSYTRSCEKSNSYSLLDYIFISRSMRGNVKNCRIVYDGGNPSDHFPIEMEIDVVPHASGDGEIPCNAHSNSVRWSSLESSHLSEYEEIMEALLDSIQVPSGIVHGDQYCCNDQHLFEIEQYFESILNVLMIADSYLPRKPPGKKGKGFWSDSLTRLKNDSIESYDRWCMGGKPTSGVLNDRRKSCHYEYKSELRRQRRLYAAQQSDSLSGKLLDKGYVGFWKEWRRASQVQCPLVNRIEDSITEPDISETFKSYFSQIYSNNSTEAHVKLRTEFDERFSRYFDEHQHDSISSAPLMGGYGDSCR